MTHHITVLKSVVVRTRNGELAAWKRTEHTGITDITNSR